MDMKNSFHLGFLVLGLCWLSHASKLADEQLIGWQGETYKPNDQVLDEVAANNQKRPWVQVLSWKPRAFIYHNFLTDAEAAHLIKLAAPQMKRSRVVGEKNDGDIDDIRTSAGTFLMRNQDAVIQAIDARLALWTGIPPSHQEDMQILRYGPTNKYGPHIDGLERVATVLIYLVPPEEGGETAFPQSNGWLHPEMGEATQGPFSQCAQGHVAYKPKRGDALLFYDVKPDYKTQDDSSMHTGCPVIKGIKWNAVKWIHGKPFNEEAFNRSLSQPFQPQPLPEDCEDYDKGCKGWAEAGECEKNPGYMIGSDTVGNCRLACNACVVCAPGDTECRKGNRRRGGFLDFDEQELKLAEIGVPPGTILGHT